MSERQWMRILVFFDLPVTTREGRQKATRFRQFLIKDGYDMLQWSVYSRLCATLESVEKHRKRIRKNLPPKGSVRLMVVTEKQFSRMDVLVGTPARQEEKRNSTQLALF